MRIKTNESRATCMLSCVATSGCGESLSYGTFAWMLKADVHIVIDPTRPFFLRVLASNNRFRCRKRYATLENRPLMHVRESDI
jgi:hypothetical protein